MSRLPAPYGDCIAEGATSNYIYKGYAYSTEVKRIEIDWYRIRVLMNYFQGCYRTCFQQLIIDRCGCGDPRFPSIGDHKLCEVFNKEHRACLEQSTQELGDIHGSFKCRLENSCLSAVIY
ncbi:hypothetical protein TELCIR_20961 [Teladorsagia circumcincta]|uniref:Uncharacterized protein n=1 Tax=Teladorsagia circumcincta TaxID=45464 RepID=A0A2G9TJV8_TELCI|nr:hypothetical protein TELCIR_20961 [Teladorsagia circumcincta]